MKHALIANGLFSAISGIALIVFRATLVALFGVGAPVLFACIGAALLVFAIMVLFEATRLRRRWMWLIIAQDAVWVIASSVLLLADPFGISGTGQLLIASVALIVLSLASWQLYALSRMPRT